MTLNDYFSYIFEWPRLADSNLCNSLYGSEYYLVLGPIFLVIGGVLTFLYYYPGGAIKARFSRWYDWLVWTVLICGGLNAFVLTAMAYKELEYSNPGTYAMDKFLIFFLVCMLSNFIYTLVISFLIRWWSPDGKSTPFPQ